MHNKILLASILCLSLVSCVNKGNDSGYKPSVICPITYTNSEGKEVSFNLDTTNNKEIVNHAIDFIECSNVKDIKQLNLSSLGLFDDGDITYENSIQTNINENDDYLSFDTTFHQHDNSNNPKFINNSVTIFGDKKEQKMYIDSREAHYDPDYVKCIKSVVNYDESNLNFEKTKIDLSSLEIPSITSIYNGNFTLDCRIKAFNMPNFDVSFKSLIQVKITASIDSGLISYMEFKYDGSVTKNGVKYYCDIRNSVELKYNDVFIPSLSDFEKESYYR